MLLSALCSRTTIQDSKTPAVRKDQRRQQRHVFQIGARTSNKTSVSLVDTCRQKALVSRTGVQANMAPAARKSLRYLSVSVNMLPAARKSLRHMSAMVSVTPAARKSLRCTPARVSGTLADRKDQRCSLTRTTPASSIQWMGLESRPCRPLLDALEDLLDPIR